jgi:hypothetical protein
MSHWRTFKNDVLTNTKENLLKKAVTELGMGLELDSSIKSIRNSWGNEQVDMGLRKNGQPIALGLKKVMVDGKEKIELHGDFYSTGLNEATFMDKLSQVYSKENIIDKVNDAGWTVDNVSTDKEGNIVIDAYQYA